MVRPSVESLNEDILDWAARADNHDFLIEKPRHNLFNNILGSTNPGYAGSQLDYMATWLGAKGAAELLSGNINGWKTINLSLEYRFNSLQLMILGFDANTKRNKKSTILLSKAALTLAHAIACDNMRVYEHLGPRVLKSKADNTFIGWNSQSFEPFIARIYLEYASEQPANCDIEILDFYEGVIEGVIFNKYNSEKYIVNMCEYHLMRTDSAGIPEELIYFTHLYSVYPVEIIAFIKLCQKRGIQIKDVKHPLLNTLLETPPKITLPLKDDVLSFVKENFKVLV